MYELQVDAKLQVYKSPMVGSD